MWALFSILFGLAFLVVCVIAAWVAWSAVVLVVALVRRRKTTAGRTGLWLLAGLPVAVVGVATGTAVLWWHSNQPDVIFETEFGFPPPPDTTVLQADAFALGDSGHAHIHFRAGPPTIARIVGLGLSPGSGNFSSNLEPPPWFRPPPAPPAVAYSGENTFPPARQSFASEFRSLVYDPATGEGWYFFSGID
jgi:hypothetical protein